jgi:hypothetical protein
MTEPSLTALASARWPEAHPTGPPPPVAGFIASTFSPLVAHVAEMCLRQRHHEPPAPPERAERTAIVIATTTGDLTTAVAVARAVDTAARVGPLLFFQAVPNAVAGYIAARWGLGGPVTCLSPAAGPDDALAAALEVAALLIDDGDADEVLVIRADQDPDEPARDSATALLVRGHVAPARPDARPDPADGPDCQGVQP